MRASVPTNAVGTITRILLLSNVSMLHRNGDVQSMIRVLKLTEELADQLNPSVRAKYQELWAAVRNNPSEI